MRVIAVLALCGMAAAMEVIMEAEQPKMREGLKAYYVNTESSTERAKCMSQQLLDQGIEAERYPATVLPKCGDWDFKCFQNTLIEKNKDCFPAGADLLHMFQHGSDVNKSKVQIASGVLANWCSHKRLFEKLSANRPEHYSVDDFKQKALNKFLRLNQKKEEPVNATKKDRVFIIMEDDAILKPNFGAVIEDFVQNYKGQWDLVQLDTFGSVRNEDKVDEYKGKNVYKPSALAEYFGLHCILVKESSVSKINFEMGLIPAVPVDWFPKLLKDVPDTTVLSWGPDVVINPEVKMWHGYTGSDFLPKYCSQDVTLSVIGGEKN